MGNPRCHWVRDRLPLLVGDDLRGPERRRVERHLIGCPQCHQHQAALGQALETLRTVAASAPASPDAPSLWPALARQIRESRRPSPTPSFASPFPLFVSWLRENPWPALGLGLALLAAATVSLGVRQQTAAAQAHILANARPITPTYALPRTALTTTPAPDSGRELPAPVEAPIVRKLPALLGSNDSTRLEHGRPMPLTRCDARDMPKPPTEPSIRAVIRDDTNVPWICRKLLICLTISGNRETPETPIHCPVGAPGSASSAALWSRSLCDAPHAMALGQEPLLRSSKDQGEPGSGARADRPAGRRGASPRRGGRTRSWIGCHAGVCHVGWPVGGAEGGDGCGDQRRGRGALDPHRSAAEHSAGGRAGRLGPPASRGVAGERCRDGAHPVADQARRPRGRSCSSPHEPRLGGQVLVIGNPFGLGHSVLRGYISGLNRRLEAPGRRPARQARSRLQSHCIPATAVLW